MKSLVSCCVLLPLCFTALIAPVSADELNISYGDLPEQKLDVYTATDTVPKAEAPVVIWVHGGGWRNGDKDNLGGKRLCKSWANHGVTMVNLNNRLTPDVVHPAHVQD
ncbi:MAG: carboxylesterase family protein [Planctomycetales bacterium]|nr:carboxylesterase family protein [Planctomycetales bacterium]